jgi:hypothetical protein
METSFTIFVKSVCYLVAKNGTETTVVQGPANR